MNPRLDQVDELARVIDRVVFRQPGAAPSPDAQPAALALVSYLSDSFPRVSVAAGRRERLQRRVIRALAIPGGPAPAGWVRLEAEMNRRLGSLDPKWTPVVGGAALVILGVVGFAVWRQRGAARPAIAGLR